MYAHLCLFTYACCALSVLKRQTDTRFPTGVSTSGCRKNGFQRGAGFFRRPDGCLFSFLFFPLKFLSFFFPPLLPHDYFQPFRRNIRPYTGFSKRFHVFLLDEEEGRFHRQSQILSSIFVAKFLLFQFFYAIFLFFDHVFICFNWSMLHNWKFCLRNLLS